MTESRWTREQLDSILEHNEKMRTACRVAIGNIMQIPKNSRGKILEAQLKYWKHCLGAFAWSDRIAQTSRKAKHVGQSKSI